jgi:hypothetical protein
MGPENFLFGGAPNSRTGGGDHGRVRGGHGGAKTPSDRQREVRSSIATKIDETSGGVGRGSQGDSVAARRGERRMGLGRTGLAALCVATGSDPDTRMHGSDAQCPNRKSSSNLR